MASQARAAVTGKDRLEKAANEWDCQFPGCVRERSQKRLEMAETGFNISEMYPGAKPSRSR